MMKDLELVYEKEKEHYMQCPGCGNWFDMRDLEMVMLHEHWMEVMPEVSFSHTKKMGVDEEVYIKRVGKIITLRQLQAPVKRLWDGKP